MRVKLLGNSDAVSVIEHYMHLGKIIPTTLDATYTLTVNQNDTLINKIIVDSVECDFESNLVRHICELASDGVEIVLRRKGGEVKTDNVVLIEYPKSEEARIELACYRGLIDHRKRCKPLTIEPPAPALIPEPEVQKQKQKQKLTIRKRIIKWLQ